MIPGGVRPWLLSESLGDGREILRVGKTVSALPSLRFGLVTNKIINIGKLSTENLDNEGGKEVGEDIVHGRSHPGNIETAHPTISFLEAFLLSSGTGSVPRVGK